MKKQSTKLLALLMCLVLAVGLLPASALADEQGGKHRAIFTADDVTAKAGETVDINVNITENEGIAAGLVTLSCDQVVIDKIARGDWTPVLYRPDHAYNTENGMYDWYQPVESSSEGVYAVYTVTVNDDVVPGTYDIVLVAEDLAGVQTKEDGEEVVVSYKDGEYAASQTYIATLTVLGDEPAPSADVVADTVTATCGEGETADVNISYVGESEITSILLKIDSVIPVEFISSEYEFEYNDQYGLITIYKNDGSSFEENVIATLHFNLDVYQWYSDAEYPIHIEVVDATDNDANDTILTSEDGALIIENIYKPGDVNMDGIVDNRDVIMIARYIVKLLDFNDRQIEIADFNMDGKVSNSDLVLVCRYIVG